MFLKVAANLGDASTEILEANSPADIDALRLRKVKLVTHDFSTCEQCEVPVISDAVRSMVDNICYIPVYASSDYV